MKVEVTSKKIVDEGLRKLEWVTPRLRILNQLREEFERERPLEGLRIGICLHIEPKMGGFLQTLQAGGANIAVTGSPGTTQDDVAMAFASMGIEVYGTRKDKRAEHLENIREILQSKPHLLMDNGADLAAMFIDDFDYEGIIGGIEETTSGANRLRGAYRGKVQFPIIVINDSPLKLIVENEHGVGQTVVEGFMRATNLMIPGKRFVVLGYGSCGKGVAKYLRKFGGRVIAVDIDPIKALEAAVDGIEVADIEDVLEWGEVFITVTGQPNVLTLDFIKEMSQGTILVNAGHFSSEIDLDGLKEYASDIRRLTEDIDKYTLENGKEVFLIAEGEMINLASGKGNPIETMDLGLALQVLSIKQVAQDPSSLKQGPQPVPHEINQRVARLMLDAIFNE